MSLWICEKCGDLQGFTSKMRCACGGQLQLANLGPQPAAPVPASGPRTVGDCPLSADYTELEVAALRIDFEMWLRQRGVKPEVMALLLTWKQPNPAAPMSESGTRPATSEEVRDSARIGIKGSMPNDHTIDLSTPGLILLDPKHIVRVPAAEPTPASGPREEPEFDWLPAVKARYEVASTRAMKEWPREVTIDMRVVSALKDIPQLIAEVERLRAELKEAHERYEANHG